MFHCVTKAHFIVQKLSTRFLVHSLPVQCRLSLTKTAILEEYNFPIPDTCFYLTSVKTDVYFSSWAWGKPYIEGHLKPASWFLHGSNMCDELGQISDTFSSVSITRGVTDLTVFVILYPFVVQLSTPQTQQNCSVFGQQKKSNHHTPIASSQVVQTRIWIVIYRKYQHPGSIWPLLSDLPPAQGRLALLTLAHWWAPKSAFIY